MDINQTLGQLLRDLRNQKRLTLHQVAIGSNIDSPLLSKIERGERLPTLNQLKRLAEYYSLPETDLRIKYIVEKILKEFGLSKVTYDAIQIVQKILIPYTK
ncbi:helix-turn-helix domain-containing protein [Bacteroides sp.]